MSKIVTAINAMLANQKKINGVLPGATESANEIFFVYDNKFNWSMRQVNSNYLLFYYPGSDDIETIAQVADWDPVAFVRYSSDEIGTQEALETFAELFTVIKEKLYGADEALDEIIAGLI
jgi:hypothetical protein